ncbi:hypothetical protein [Cerasicoccus arenae]|uniref:Uncharacterized protein n=1 Tax=Cerasicoccus arenae TaxID=424488 RepID=A0A8J3DI74_9BACT|nr:hypothetical protein [Cerasicoccus arenae]MBK1858262.1 hypothetical protein [Cerasicoccus arenae]GHC02247.1 hypothetical protein GCM10007047_18480 [Cerasicoccus arenae]
MRALTLLIHFACCQVLTVAAVSSALAGEAKDTQLSREYAVVGVLKMDDELWLTLKHENGQMYFASSGKNRALTAVDFDWESGIATIRTRHGELLHLQLPDSVDYGADPAFARMGKDNTLVAGDDLSGLTYSEIVSLSEASPETLNVRKVLTDVNARPPRMKIHPVAVVGRFGSGFSPNRTTEISDVRSSSGKAQGVAVVGDAQLSSLKKDGLVKKAVVKRGGVITEQNDVIFPDLKEEG